MWKVGVRFWAARNPKRDPKPLLGLGVDGLELEESLEIPVQAPAEPLGLLESLLALGSGTPSKPASGCGGKLPTLVAKSVGELELGPSVGGSAG